jgi:hypothetical protein
MDALSSLGEIVRELLMVVGALTVVLILLVVTLLTMRGDNPLKRLFKLLSYRIAATLLAGIVAIPIEPIPILDALYDLGVPVALIWYWFRLFRDVRHPPQASSRQGPRRIEHGSL